MRGCWDRYTCAAKSIYCWWLLLPVGSCCAGLTAGGFKHAASRLCGIQANVLSTAPNCPPTLCIHRRRWLLKAAVTAAVVFALLCEPPAFVRSCLYILGIYGMLGALRCAVLAALRCAALCQDVHLQQVNCAALRCAEICKR